jgi:hypothetical protein
VLTPEKTACRVRRVFAECKKEREIPLWLFWKNSPKTKKSPENKRFSRRLKTLISSIGKKEMNRNGRSSILRVRNSRMNHKNIETPFGSIEPDPISRDSSFVVAFAAAKRDVRPLADAETRD